LENKGEVELILTEGILDKLVETVGEEKLAKWTNDGILKLLKIDEEVKIALTIGDDFIALGLFSADGAYDLSISLISNGDDAISWGNRLFDHYRQQATIIDLSEPVETKEAVIINK